MRMPFGVKHRVGLCNLQLQTPEKQSKTQPGSLLQLLQVIAILLPPCRVHWQISPINYCSVLPGSDITSRKALHIQIQRLPRCSRDLNIIISFSHATRKPIIVKMGNQTNNLAFTSFTGLQFVVLKTQWKCWGVLAVNIIHSILEFSR